MNATLTEIFDTRQVTNGQAKFDLTSSVSADEGEHLARWLTQVKPDAYLEVGLAYGISAMYAGTALKACKKDYKHIIIDPVQDTSWNNVGIHNLKREGLWDNVELHAKGSETALPELMAQGTRLQAAFIDGWHTMDHALVDFFYINRMMDKGGVIIFDDANWPAITKLIRYVLKYPAYEYMDGSRLNMARSVGKDLLNFRVPRLMPSMVAVRKVADDNRSWDWYSSF
jgi:predicted O-methyltransferase YrrM